MGSSDNETGLVDCSVGSIVWVRRRNGSWWPGKILGPEDLLAAHLMSPRSGTPVKLLGREDASVDWYNLEKSKRVKAFRCGEFDDCIERAESAQGVALKKREKYARREDAILHALELEKELVGLKHGQSGYPNGKVSNSSDAAKATVAPSECLGNHDDEHVVPISHLKEPDASVEGMKTGHHFHTEDDGEGIQLQGNGKSSEVIPRMRDLQDLGIRIPASKHKLSSGVTSNGSCKPLCDENTRPLPSGTLITANIIQTYSKGFLGRKRKSHAVFPDESLVKKRHKRRPLVQVLQSSPELPVQHSFPAGEEQKGILSHAERRNSICLPGESSKYLDDKPATLNSMASSPSHFEVRSQHPAALNEEHTSGSSENTETDSSETDTPNCDADVDMLEHPDATFEPRSLERSGAQGQHRSTSLKEPDDLALANDVPQLSPQDLDLAAVGVSQWQTKGKRNIRRPGKKSTDVTDRKLSGGWYGSHLDVRDNTRFDDPDLCEKNLGARGHTYDHQANLLISKSISNGLDDIVHSSNKMEDRAWNDQPSLRGYGEDSSSYHGFPGRMKSVLVDVDLRVQSSYQREHVPMISLMSKLNGKAIVGHPIQIEALENGATDILLAEAAGLYPGTWNNDDTSVPSMWKTARRTANFRVPRSHPSARSNSEHPAEDLQLFDQDKKGPVKKLKVVSSGASGVPGNKKFSRKPLKKISLSSGQKTKALSSIGLEQKAGHDTRHGNNKYLVNGLIKGDSGPTAVACIPVKLVFSRFFEDLVGRHQ